jgi:hypothetical protein
MLYRFGVVVGDGLTAGEPEPSWSFLMDRKNAAAPVSRLGRVSKALEQPFTDSTRTSSTTRT